MANEELDYDEHEKLHWSCFAYNGTTLAGERNYTASTYIGYPDKCITLARIAVGKKNAGVKDTAVLVSVIYLGYMTRKEFVGE